MQIQMRDLVGYNESRHLLLKLKPANRPYWIGLAISYHLLEKYDKAIEILDAYQESLRETTIDFEHSELVLYKNMILEESGDIAGALKHLEASRDQVLDHLAWREKRGM